MPSALVLKLSRTRRNDPYITGNDAEAKVSQAVASKDFPPLESRSRGHRAPENTTDNRGHSVPVSVDSTEIELPEYELRRVFGARDPLAVVDAYSVNVRIRLARLLGIRMCYMCPRCNDPQVQLGRNLRLFRILARLPSDLNFQDILHYDLLNLNTFEK